MATVVDDLFIFEQWNIIRINSDIVYGINRNYF